VFSGDFTGARIASAHFGTLEKMAVQYEARGSTPPEVRSKCPYCGSSAIRTMDVTWYRELEYLTCDKCKSIWTVERKPPPDSRKE
jgi:formate dehydrogenase maturation protein FdhE